MADIKLQVALWKQFELFCVLTFSKPKIRIKAWHLYIYLKIWLLVSLVVNQYANIVPALLKEKLLWNNFHI